MSPVMRIATWNLDHASNVNRPIASQIEQIKAIAPDILVLTETCEDVVLATHGYPFSLTSQKNKYQKYYSTIWSKYPILNTIKTYDPETSVCAEVQTPLGNALVYGTIITYFGDRGPDESSPSPNWFEHHKAIKEHGDDWNQIYYNEYDCRLPLLVCGDFNQPRDGSQSNRSKDGQNISMLSDELDRNNLNCLTNENFGASGKLTKNPNNNFIRNNIDHICLTNNAFAVKYVGAWDHFTESGIFMSDHNGVYVDLALTSAWNLPL